MGVGPVLDRVPVLVGGAREGAQLIVISELAEELEETFADTAPDLPTALAMAEERLGPEATIIALHDGRRVICT